MTVLNLRHVPAASRFDTPPFERCYNFLRAIGWGFKVLQYIEGLFQVFIVVVALEKVVELLLSL